MGINKLTFRLVKLEWQISNKDQFKKEFNEYFKKLDDWNYNCEIKKYRKNRSLSQNKYYWLTIAKFADEVDVTPADLHEELKYELLSTHFTWIKWEDIVKIKSTSNLNTVQMEEYLERIRKKAMEEYNLYLELPNETQFSY